MMFLHDYPYMGDALARYGSKAANLGRLMQEGLRVPNGLVIEPKESLGDIKNYVES